MMALTSQIRDGVITVAVLLVPTGKTTQRVARNGLMGYSVTGPASHEAPMLDVSEFPEIRFGSDSRIVSKAIAHSSSSIRNRPVTRDARSADLRRRRYIMYASRLAFGSIHHVR